METEVSEPADSDPDILEDDEYNKDYKVNKCSEESSDKLEQVLSDKNPNMNGKLIDESILNADNTELREKKKLVLNELKEEYRNRKKEFLLELDDLLDNISELPSKSSSTLSFEDYSQKL
ncbi:hypothetical protein HWI79_1159 [Cryptosporidium felis]|nr:hypothetical protein HWI79_1159 [Cryptosporidium felis]